MNQVTNVGANTKIADAASINNNLEHTRRRPRGLPCRWDSFQFPAVEGKPVGQLLYFPANIGHRRFRIHVANNLGDECCCFTHLRLAETARGYSWAAQANAARVERRVYIERDSVLVDGDAPAIQCRFGFFSADPLRKP